MDTNTWILISSHCAKFLIKTNIQHIVYAHGHAVIIECLLIKDMNECFKNQKCECCSIL